MRLAALLAELPPHELDRLAAEHLGQDENVTKATLSATLEGVLRSYSFVRKFVGDRLPPTFSIMEVLLDAEGARWPASTFRDVVAERTQKIVESVAAGELVGRDSSLRLYRRVLLEARRNDLVIDASEAAILGVLRRELSIRPVEHFLIEHHPDFDDIWRKETAFLDEMNALRSSGLVFAHEADVVLAEEVIPLVRQTLGLEMRTPSRRRLYDRLSGGDLTTALASCGAKTSGSRDEKLERLMANYVQPSEVLRELPLATLREICRDANASVSGSKDELVDRLVEHFLHDLDIRPPSEVPAASSPPAEPRTLDGTRFRAMFSSLKGDELSDILVGIDSTRVTGAKETKVALIASSPFCEITLLDKLTSRSLEEALARHHLRTAGSKRERVERLVEFFRTVPEMLLGNDAPPPSLANPGGATTASTPPDESSHGD